MKKYKTQMENKTSKEGNKLKSKNKNLNQIMRQKKEEKT